MVATDSAGAMPEPFVSPAPREDMNAMRGSSGGGTSFGVDTERESPGRGKVASLSNARKSSFCRSSDHVDGSEGCIPVLSTAEWRGLDDAQESRGTGEMVAESSPMKFCKLTFGSKGKGGIGGSAQT